MFRNTIFPNVALTVLNIDRGESLASIDLGDIHFTQSSNNGSNPFTASESTHVNPRSGTTVTTTNPPYQVSTNTPVVPITQSTYYQAPVQMAVGQSISNSFTSTQHYHNASNTSATTFSAYQDSNEQSNTQFTSFSSNLLPDNGSVSTTATIKETTESLNNNSNTSTKTSRKPFIIRLKEAFMAPLQVKIGKESKLGKKGRLGKIGWFGKIEGKINKADVHNFLTGSQTNHAAFLMLLKKSKLTLIAHNTDNKEHGVALAAIKKKSAASPEPKTILDAFQTLVHNEELKYINKKLGTRRARQKKKQGDTTTTTRKDLSILDEATASSLESTNKSHSNSDITSTKKRKTPQTEPEMPEKAKKQKQNEQQNSQQIITTGVTSNSRNEAQSITATTSSSRKSALNSAITISSNNNSNTSAFFILLNEAFKNPLRVEIDRRNRFKEIGRLDAVGWFSKIEDIIDKAEVRGFIRNAQRDHSDFFILLNKSNLKLILHSNNNKEPGVALASIRKKSDASNTSVNAETILDTFRTLTLNYYNALNTSTAVQGSNWQNSTPTSVPAKIITTDTPNTTFEEYNRAYCSFIPPASNDNSFMLQQMMAIESNMAQASVIPAIIVATSETTPNAALSAVKGYKRTSSASSNNDSNPGRKDGLFAKPLAQKSSIEEQAGNRPF